jgi:hypothetical protein
MAGEDEPTLEERIAAAIGYSASSLSMYDVKGLSSLKAAFEVIDGVDEVRKNLQIAAYGDPDDPNDEGGHLNKAIGKKLGLSTAAMKNFTPTPSQVSDYIEDIVSESAEMAHAKAHIIQSYVITLFSTHLATYHGVTVDDELELGGAGTAPPMPT